MDLALDVFVDIDFVTEVASGNLCTVVLGLDRKWQGCKSSELNMMILICFYFFNLLGIFGGHLRGRTTSDPSQPL